MIPRTLGIPEEGVPKMKGLSFSAECSQYSRGNRCPGLYRCWTLKRVEELDLLIYTCFKVVELVCVLFQVWMLKGIRLNNNQIS